MATAHRSRLSVPDVAATRVLRPGLPLNVSRIAIYSAAVIALLFVTQAGEGGNIVFFAVLIGMIVQSPELAFKAMTIGFLGLVSNQAIVPKTPLWTVARFLIPILCMVRFSLDLQRLRYSLFKHGYFVALTAFIVVAATLSIMTQYFVEIALLKLVNFAVATTAILSGVQVLRMRKSDLTEWFVTICCITVVLGFGSLATGIGYNMRGGTGTGFSTFNGSMYHSNCFGPLSAMMAVYLVCVALFGRYRNRWLCLALIGCLVYFMALTQSRTSFASLFVGIFTTIAMSFILVRGRLIRLRLNSSRIAVIGAIAAAGIVLLIIDAATGNTVTKAVVAFANKGGKSDQFDYIQALSSRQSLIDMSWNNFLNSPWIGIGFEVSTTEFFRRNASFFYAPIEKGFLPVAVLEETGIIGAIFLVIFLLAYVRALVRSLNIPGIALFLTFLAVNCGEAMFFAVGGHGGFGWLLCAAGAMLGDFCVERIGPTPASQARTATEVG